jgi:hypothetical protein
MERPCGICFFSFEEHKPYLDRYERPYVGMEHLFCPDQDLSEGPAEAFYCYVPCGNLLYLEYLSKRKEVVHE